MYKCSCLKEFSHKKDLNEHMKSCFRGNKYICNKCGYMSNYSENIESEHVKICSKREDMKIIIEFDDNNTIKSKIKELETENSKLRTDLMKLNMIIDKERIFSRMYKQLIKDNTNIKISDYIEEKNDGIHFYKYLDEGKMKYIIHNLKPESSDLKPNKECVKINETPIITTDNNICEEKIINQKKKSRKRSTRKNRKGETFRTLKNIKTKEEKGQEEIFNYIQKIDEENEKEIVEIFGEIKIQKSKSDIEDIFKLIQNNEGFENKIRGLSRNRMKLLRFENMITYEKIVKFHFDKMNNILKRNKHSEKNIKKYLNKSLNSIEKRILLYDKYYNSVLDVDEVLKLKTAIFRNFSHNKEFKPFEHSFEIMTNYSVCFIPLQEYIENIVINVYGFQNIIYLEHSNSSNEDPYTFYLLEECQPSRRLWKMDCRLSQTSSSLTDCLLTFCEDLFKRIYYDIFKDNDYREDFKKHSQTTMCDCTQILSNIFILANTKKCRNMFRDIIKNKCVYVPTSLDKFNSTADDKFQKAIIKNEDFNKDVKFSLLNRLFDKITEDQCRSFVV